MPNRFWVSNKDYLVNLIEDQRYLEEEHRKKIHKKINQIIDYDSDVAELIGTLTRRQELLTYTMVAITIPTIFTTLYTIYIILS